MNVQDSCKDLIDVYYFKLLLLPVPSAEVFDSYKMKEIKMNDITRKNSYCETYKTVNSCLHEYENISQFYANGYSKEIIDCIFSIVKTTKIDKQVTMVLQKINKNDVLRNMIALETSFLDVAIQNKIVNQHKIRINERLYCILNGIHEIPNCKVCGSPLKNFEISRTNSLHYDCCSVKCKANDPNNIEKRVKKFMSRSPEEKLKTKLQTENTIEQRFGNRCFMKTDYFKQKSLEYIKANGGECNVSQIKEVRDKVDKTNIDTYGNRCNLANKEQLEKRRLSYQKHYGVDHPMKSKEFIQHFSDEFAKTHNGLAWPSQLESSKEKLRNRVNERRRRIIKANTHIIALFNIDDENNLDPFDKQFWWQCLDCGHVFASHIIGYNENTNMHITTCPFCRFDHKLSGYSSQEVDFVNFLRSSFPNMEIIHRNCKVNRHIIPPYEVDIWIPEKNIAIEYNGTFWHSVEFEKQYNTKKSRKFNLLAKTKLCEQKGIHLIHVYEDEWVNNNEQIKKLVANLINDPSFYENAILDDAIVLPYDKYASFMKIPDYELVDVTPPILHERYASNDTFYHVYDCGNLVFKHSV